MATAQKDDANVVIQKSLISKYFPGVVALHHVDFEVRRGESHALVG